MSTQPTTGHSENFRDGYADGRLVNQTFERNSKPVIDGLSQFLGNVSGNALEIGSGTGQHVCAFAAHFPTISWTPSEPDQIHRTSINAWRGHLGSPANAAIEIDASADWTNQTDVQKIAPLSLILSMNVIHIAPFAVALGIFKGAGKTLARGGFLTFYGPFAENGQHTGEGNRIFDERLRNDNPKWGVRDVAELQIHAQANGMGFAQLLEMPSNNRLLVFVKN